jgi:hypothetical protein
MTADGQKTTPCNVTQILTEVIAIAWRPLSSRDRIISVGAILSVLIGIFLAPSSQAQFVPETKLSVRAAPACSPPGNVPNLVPRPPLPWQIAREWERIGGPSSPIGCPIGNFVADVPNGGYVKFENGQIAISLDVWEQGVVAAYRDDWGRLVVDWTVSWTDPSHYNYTKFVVRWDFNNQHYDNWPYPVPPGTDAHDPPCERGDGDQCDIFADMTEVQIVLLSYIHDTHLRTKGTFFLPTKHGDGLYRISVEGCDQGALVGGSSCKQGWMHPVTVDYRKGDDTTNNFPVDLRPAPDTPNTLIPSDGALHGDFFLRSAAIILYEACRLLPWTAYRNEGDYGDIILAKLAYFDFYKEDHCPGRVTSNRTEAFESLLRQSVESKTGTTRDTAPPFRTGEYDVALSAYITVIERFGTILPRNVYDHILNDLLNKRGPIDSGDFDLFNTVSETENHLNLIESAQYLTNEILFGKTGDRQFNNDTNGFNVNGIAGPGLTTWWLGVLRNVLLTDFVEYNARPYQSYTAIALQNLFSNAKNENVRAAAGMVLDYISAKIAMSSNQNRRAAPYRRKASYNDPALLGWHADPQAGRSLALAGDLAILYEAREGGGWAPWYGAGDMLRAVLSNYRIYDPLLDLIINPSHRTFYQGLHHYADELYASSPSFLISAGGHHATCAYPVSPLAGNEVNVCFEPDDFGIALPTTIMPTGRFISRDDLVRFEGNDDETRRSNMCVAPNFACGLKPVIADSMSTKLGQYCVDTNTPPWTFINFSETCNGGVAFGAPAASGFYLAVFNKQTVSDSGSNIGMGFLEAFDTKVNPGLGFNQFKTLVLQQNREDRSHSYTLTGTNKYVTVTGEEINFTISPDSRIVSIRNGPTFPQDTPMAFGDIVESDAGSGVATITNRYTGEVLILDFHDPAHPFTSYSAVQPYTNMSCLPGFVLRQADNADRVCVTQAIRDQVALQNSLGPSRSQSGTIACLPSFIWRGASATDRVCVTPAEHAQAQLDNLLAPSRRAIP